MNIDRELSLNMLMRSEEGRIHTEYLREYGFYENIACGNIEEVKKYLSDTSDTGRYESDEYGRLSDDSMRNIRYHFVVAAAMIARLCADKGLDRETAYTISDIYINKMDKARCAEDIIDLHNKMIVYYTRKMAELPRNRADSVYVRKAVDYISSNLTKRLLVEDISAEIGLNPNYLSKLFLKETGIKLSEYIRSEKLNEAAFLLKYSEKSSVEIAMYLNFCSQSSFVQCFKKQFGVTPGAYKRQYSETSPNNRS